ncbi:MAG: HD domain-containing protein [Euryarchaeota archaeon]|nr:HD domain-containing protein [Euryarchaeota archaeon]
MKEDIISKVFKSEIFRKTYEFAKKHSKKGGTHGWDHVLRVLDLSIKIGMSEGADVEVLALAALLHDIARPLEEKGLIKDHARESAKIAKEFLDSLGYDKSNKVYEAIISHSFSSGLKARSLEAKILSDADKIDAIGAVGIARVFMYSGEHDRTIEESIEHFYEKILKLKDLMYTKTGKEIAEERHRFTVKFIERLKDELSGKK